MQTIAVNNVKIKKDSKPYDVFIVLGLVASFFVFGIFRAFETGNGTNIVTAGMTASSSFVVYVFYNALLSWLLFELVMRCYYFLVSFSIFSFVVPKKRFYYTFRAFWAIRNVIVAGIYFLLFASPIFINYVTLMVLIVDFLVFVGMFLWLKTKYFKLLMAPFAWRAFLRPFIVFETILVCFTLGGVL